MFEHIDIVLPPEDEPVTLAQAHSQGRDIPEEDDELLQGMLIAARERCEAFTRRSLCTQTLDVWYNDPDGVGYFELPRGKVQEVNGIYTYDIYGIEMPVESEIYTLQGTDLILLDWLTNYRTRRGIKVRIVSGYGDPEDVPSALKQGILEFAIHMYDHREGEAPDARYEVQAQGANGIPKGVTDKWTPYRLMMV